jgi:hypothetical protein
MIWKMQHYCTPHHQDVHIPPHFTVYNQVCGLSTFHFLPLLLGLFAAHVGKVRRHLTPAPLPRPAPAARCSRLSRPWLPPHSCPAASPARPLARLLGCPAGQVRGPAALAALLLELGRRQIGQLCTIGPKQMVLILPFGSHGARASQSRLGWTFLAPALPCCDALLCRGRENEMRAAMGCSCQGCSCHRRSPTPASPAAAPTSR